MKIKLWHPRLICSQVPPQIASWLFEPASITKRCLATSSNFRVRVLASGPTASNKDECCHLPKSCRQVWVREVLLELDDTPIIFARTTHPSIRRGPLLRRFARLGNSPLGSILFTHPGFRKIKIEYARLDRRHPLYQQAMNTNTSNPTLWARRASWHLGHQHLLLTEVFLPSLASYPPVPEKPPLKLNREKLIKFRNSGTPHQNR